MRLDNITYKKISSKEELKESLNRYKRILNPRVIDYLNQLVELEFSAVKDIIDIEDREILQNLDLYKNVVAYNIYNRTLELLSNEQELKIFDNKDRISGLMAYKDIGNVRDAVYNCNSIKKRTIRISYDETRTVI